MRYFEFIKNYDVSQVAAELAANEELWDANRQRKDAPGSAHSRMSDIWVRYNDVEPYRRKSDYRDFNEKHVPIWYPAWHRLPSLRPIVFDLMSTVEGEMLGGVLITRIPSTLGIEPHVDKSWHVDYYDKFYISIKSAPGAEFHTEGEFINPKVGECWLFDNRLKHWVLNKSDEDRITLIVCIRTEKYGRV